MSEKLIFVMPDSTETLLFASVVMSQYLQTRMVLGRSSSDVVIVCKNREVHSYLNACWGQATVTEKATEDQIEDADFVFSFDERSSYQLTKEVQKHMSDAFGIQLGVNLLRFLPAILVEDQKEDVSKTLIVERTEQDGRRGFGVWDWVWMEDFVALLKEQGVPIKVLGKQAGWEETRIAVGQASVVIGVRGTATTMGAAANRLVLELVPDQAGHQDWVRKKECRTYRMIYGDMDKMTSEFVWKSLMALIKDCRTPGKEKANV